MALRANVRLGLKGLAVANTLVYKDIELITAIKCFTVQAFAGHSDADS
jgi:hypothetical protein